MRKDMTEVAQIKSFFSLTHPFGVVEKRPFFGFEPRRFAITTT